MKTTKMNFIIIYLFLFASLIFPQQNEKIIKTEKGGKLNIQFTVGDITLITSENDEIKIFGLEEDEDDAFTIKQSGGRINIISKSYGSDLKAYIPNHFDVEISNQGGDIKLNGTLTGDIKIVSAAGDIKTDEVNGEVNISTAGGDIKCGNINGNAKITSAGGSISLGKIKGILDLKTAGGNIKTNDISKDVEAITYGGNVQIGNCGGSASVTSGGGNIKIGKVTSTAKIKSGGGNISLDGASNSVDVVTGSGNINLKNVEGKIESKTGAGDIHIVFSSSPKENSSVRTTQGNIFLTFPSNAKATVDASVQSYEWNVSAKKDRIYSDFPTKSEGGKDKNSSVYSVNGGGNTIKVETNVGNIEIKKK